MEEKDLQIRLDKTNRIIKKTQVTQNDESIALSQETDNNKLTNRQNNTQLPVITEYPNYIAPPYKIIVQPNTVEGSSDNPVKNLHPLDVARKIVPNFANRTIEEIKGTGKNRVTITTYDRKVANTILSSNIFKENNWRALIPNSYVYKKIIIKNVLPDLSNDEIMNHLELFSMVEKPLIQSVYRYQRKTVEEGKEKYVPTTTIQVTYTR